MKQREKSSIWYLTLSLEAKYLLPQAGLPALGSSPRIAFPLRFGNSGIMIHGSPITVAGQRRTFTGLPVHLRHNMLNFICYYY